MYVLVQERCNSSVLAMELHVFLALTHQHNYPPILWLDVHLQSQVYQNFGVT